MQKVDLMHDLSIIVETSPPLQGQVKLEGAKNAVLVIMASLLLTSGRSVLRNVPPSHDIFSMKSILEALGAIVIFDEIARILYVDTTYVYSLPVPADAVQKMRASALVMGPLLTRFGSVAMLLPGGCKLGVRPIDFYLRAFQKMGADVSITNGYVQVVVQRLHARTFVLEYPSVGATESILMVAATISARTVIMNGATEPEVIDLIQVLRAMGAVITIESSGEITIFGAPYLKPVDHTIMPDRLEAGTFLLAAAVTGGIISIPEARADHLWVFLEKLSDMGHAIECGSQNRGITLRATERPIAVSFRTMPYPGFPTDLQAPMVVAQVLARGTSVVYETVFEKRLTYVTQLHAMGACIEPTHDMAITVHGPVTLQGASVKMVDIRAGAAVILAGLVASGRTIISQTFHIKRGYVNFVQKLAALGARITMQGLSNDSMVCQPLDILSAVTTK